MKLQADTINGVTQLDADTDLNAVNVIDVEDFYDSLRTLKDGKKIYCVTFNDAMIYKIGKEYGIN